MTRTYVAALSPVHNRGRAPVAFLDELMDWGIQASSAVFAPNASHDIYASVVGELGPWTGPMHRRAAMLEVLRVLGGFESSWDWKAGVDVTNPTSNMPCTEEAGIFQCSGNSMSFSTELKDLLRQGAGKTTCEAFIAHTKADHRFAIEYCARLLRFTIAHHGPVKRKEINSWLRKDAVAEFEDLLTAGR